MTSFLGVEYVVATLFLTLSREMQIRFRRYLLRKGRDVAPFRCLISYSIFEVVIQAPRLRKGEEEERSQFLIVIQVPRPCGNVVGR